MFYLKLFSQHTAVLFFTSLCQISGDTLMYTYLPINKVIFDVHTLANKVIFDLHTLANKMIFDLI